MPLEEALPAYVFELRPREDGGKTEYEHLVLPPEEHIPTSKVKDVNPFSNPAPWTACDTAKLLLLGPTLLPVRVVLVLVFAILSYIVALLSTLGFPLEDHDQCLYHDLPLSRWRQIILLPMSLIMRGILWCCGFWSVEVIDRRRDRSVTPNLIVCGPHLSNVDVFMIQYAFGSLLAGVGDVDILRAPVVARLGVASQGIFVNLKSDASRKACKEAIAARASSSWTGRPLMIFPEGRITNGKALIQFKLGAFIPGQPVLPVILRYPNRYFDLTGASRANGAGALWPVRLMTQVYNRCQVEVLDVCAPKLLETPEQFAERVRGLMANELGVPTTEHSYADAAFFLDASKAGVTPDFEVQAVQKRFGELDVKEWLKLFKQADKDGDGKISHAELATFLGYPIDSTSDSDSPNTRLFQFFDSDQSGSIEYREFLQCVAICNNRGHTDSKVKLAFLILDTRGNGKVSTEILCEMLSQAKPPLSGLGRFEGKAELSYAEFAQLVEEEPRKGEQLLEAAGQRIRLKGD